MHNDEPIKTKSDDMLQEHSTLQVASTGAVVGDTAPERKKRGRPVGSIAQTMAKPSFFQLEDFFFLRSVINGLSAKESFIRYYAHLAYNENGDVVLPHGHQLNAMAKTLTAAILEQVGRIKITTAELQNDAQVLDTNNDGLQSDGTPIQEIDAKTSEAVHLGFEDWVYTLPDGMYSESELPERYLEYIEDSGAVTPQARQMIDETITINAKLRALNRLQTALAYRPIPSHETEIWFTKQIATAMARAGAPTLEGLVKLVQIAGRTWYKTIWGLKEVRARRIEQWLEFHEETLGRIDKSVGAWRQKPRLTALPRLSRPPSVQVTTIDADTGQIQAPSPARSPNALLPLELLVVPKALDGHNGTFRTNTPNLLGASTDAEAIFSWLQSYLNANKLKTFDAYRREVERFYLWCLSVAKCPLSSVTLAHAQDYQKFLSDIPNQWISSARVSRGDKDWRPFRGPITPKSQNYAIGVIRHLYDHLVRNAYLTGNPFASVQASTHASRGRTLDATRSFDAPSLELIRLALDSLPGLTSSSPLKRALARRKCLIMHLGLTTGLRISEISGATTNSLRRPVVDGEVGDDWIIDVVGKRSKVREIPISSSLYRMIKDHHADWLDLTPETDRRRQSFLAMPPLVAALEAPVPDAKLNGSIFGELLHQQRISFESVQKGVSTAAPSSSAEERGYKHRQITDETVLSADNAALSPNAIHRTMKSFFKFAASLTDDQYLRGRLLEASAHWLRHTFAHEILSNNKNDEGLASAQALLGHSSIAVTGEYTKQDISAKIKAARRVNPLGL